MTPPYAPGQPRPPALAYPADLFTHLLGHWSLTRDIPGHATALGHAIVTLLSPGSALYEEHVTLHLPDDTRLPGTASYLLRQISSCSLDVLFPRTGELFEHLEFFPDAEASLTAVAIHLCPPDRYNSTWRLLPTGDLTITHRVLGPRKNYTAHTVLTRLTP